MDELLKLQKIPLAKKGIKKSFFRREKLQNLVSQTSNLTGFVQFS